MKGLRATPFGPGFPLPRIREDRPRFHEDKLRGNDPPEADLRRTGGLGVSPRINSLESLFDKEGLREFGAKGLTWTIKISASM